MADHEPTQEEKPTLTSEQVDDIGTVYYNGLRTTLVSYLLERLLMALALQIVNDSVDSDGQFQYAKAKHVLDEFKEKSKGGFEHKRQVITKEDVYKEIRDEAKNLQHKQGDDRKTSLEKIKVLDNLIFKLLEKQPKNTEEELKKDCIPKERRIMKLLEETENLSNGTCQDNIESLKKLREHRRKIPDVWKAESDPSQHYINLLNEAKNLLNGTYVNKVKSLTKITDLGQLISKDSEKRRRKKLQELAHLGAKITCKAKHKISDDEVSLFDFARERLKRKLDRMLPSEEHTLSPDVCKMIRVAAVYEEFLCMKPHWYNFVKDKIRELLFGDKTIDTAHPQNPMDLIKYLFLDRNQAAHSSTSGKTTSIKTFMKQLDYVDELLHPYFQDSGSAAMSDEDKKKNLKLLFGDCDAINVIDETYNDMKETYPNFEKRVKDVIKSFEDGVSDAKDEEAWSRVKMYYDHHPNSCEDNGYYTMLLKEIKNHQKILDNHAQENCQPLQHLRALHELNSMNPEKAKESVFLVLLEQRLQELLQQWILEQEEWHRQEMQARRVHALNYPHTFERDNMDRFDAQHLIARRPPHLDLDLDSYITEPHD